MTASASAAQLKPISLSDLNAVAALQTRRDRKYLVDEAQLGEMFGAFGDQHRALQIDGRRQFGYQSAYFDTVALDLFRAAATSRRRRYKVRTRTYLDSGLCMLEVKTKGGRGETAKHRFEYHAADRSRLTAGARQFIAGSVSQEIAASTLTPVLTTCYERSTFVDLASSTRLTVDANLVCTDWTGRSVMLGTAIVETKSSDAPSPTDRWLWASGNRPLKISKFCTGLAALHPSLRSNKWHRALQRDWTDVRLDAS